MTIWVLRHLPGRAIQAAFSDKDKAESYLKQIVGVVDVIPVLEDLDRHGGFLIRWDGGSVWDMELLPVDFDPLVSQEKADGSNND